MKIMRKLKKLILHPKKFFQDSWLFKKDDFGDISNYDNIFIVSNLSQLNTAQQLIRYEKLEKCYCIILWTKRNIKMPKLIENSIDNNLIEGFTRILLPNSPNNYNLKSLRKMRNNYKSLVCSMSKNTTLYTQSFENHYSLLLNIANNQGIPIMLIDEGTGTYKPKKEIVYNIFKKGLFYVLDLYSATKWHTEFIKVYASFPELLQNTFSAKEYISFFAHGGNLDISINTKELVKKYNITSNDFIYVNQRYPIDNDNFVESITLILEQITQYYKCKIFVKMHPKDTEALQNYFKLKLENNENIIFIEENEFLIEETIQYIKPRGIIGLTSTALVNAPLISPLTIPISITPWFLSLLRNQNTEIIENHYEILKLFEHIKHLTSQNDLEKINLDKKIKIDYKKYDYKTIAEIAYSEGKYKKTIINYMWAYPEGIETIKEGDFIKFIDATNNICNIRVVSEIYNNWINHILVNEEEIELDKYLKVLMFITKIINKNIEIFQNRVWIENINNASFALVTASLSQNKCNIKRVKEEHKLLNSSKDKLLFLLLFRIEDYILTQQDYKAESLIKSIIEENNIKDEEENLYKKLLECLIKQNKIEEAKELNTYIQGRNDFSNNIKIICQSVIDIVEEEYDNSLTSLLKVMDELTLDEKKVLKLELLISRLYRLKEEYELAKRWLILYEKHSKGDIGCHREIAYLEYEQKNYKKAIAQFKKAYPQGIETIKEGDFIKFIDATFSLKYFDLVTEYLHNKILDNEILKYYYLYSLFKLKKYNDFLNELDKANLMKLNHKYLFNVKLSEIKIYKKKGLFENAYNLLPKLEYNKIIEIDKIEDILDLIDVYTVNDDFHKVDKLWKVLLSKFDDEIPFNAWERFYNNKLLMSKTK